MIDSGSRIVTDVSTRRVARVTLRALALLGVLIASAIPATAAQTLFQNGFETGIVPPWSSSSNMVVDTATVHTGLQASRNTSSVAWAEKKLSLSSFD